MSTKIEWTDEVWNPITGCSKGCPYCYARPFAARLQANPATAHQYRNGFRPTFHSDRLDIPGKWKKPRRIFVNSMGDLFDPGIKYEHIESVFTTMARYPQHTFMVLTKNSQRMDCFMSALLNSSQNRRRELSDLDNVWLGVSITGQQDLRRWWDLYYTPAAHRFVSIEPMQGPIRFDCLHCHGKGHYDDNDKTFCPNCNGRGVSFDRLDWFICGGQTGHRAVSLHPNWVNDLRDRTHEAGVPFFFKGWGTVNGKKGDAILNGRECKEFPEGM